MSFIKRYVDTSSCYFYRTVSFRRAGNRLLIRPPYLHTVYSHIHLFNLILECKFQEVGDPVHTALLYSPKACNSALGSISAY